MCICHVETDRLYVHVWAEASRSWQIYCKFLPCSSLSIGLGGAMESTVASMSVDEVTSWRTQSSTVAGHFGTWAARSTQTDTASTIETQGWTDRRPRCFLSELVMPPDSGECGVRAHVGQLGCVWLKLCDLTSCCRIRAHGRLNKVGVVRWSTLLQDA